MFFIALNSQPDGKSQSYRIRFYSDDTSSLPILEIMSRFHGYFGSYSVRMASRRGKKKVTKTDCFYFLLVTLVLPC